MPFIHSFIHSVLIYSFIPSFIHPFSQSVSHATFHSNVHSLFRSCVQWFIHYFVHSLINFVNTFVESCVQFFDIFGPLWDCKVLPDWTVFPDCKVFRLQSFKSFSHAFNHLSSHSFVLDELDWATRPCVGNFFPFCVAS